MFKLLFIPIILLSAFFGTNQTMIASTHEPITQIEFTTKIANLEKLWERKAAQAHNQLIKTQLEAQIVHHETFQKAIRRYKFFSFSKVATGSLQALGNTFCGYSIIKIFLSFCRLPELKKNIRGNKQTITPLQKQIRMCLIMFALSFSTPLPKEFHARSTKKYLMSIAPSDLLPFFDATTESLKWTWFRADKINTFIDTVYCMSMQKSKALKALLDQLDTQKSE